MNQIDGNDDEDWEDERDPDWVDKSDSYFRDDEGAVIHCPLCKAAKLAIMCVEGEFSCNDLNREHACEGWSDACCECGYAYGQCQM